MTLSTVHQSKSCPLNPPPPPPLHSSPPLTPLFYSCLFFLSVVDFKVVAVRGDSQCSSPIPRLSLAAPSLQPSPSPSPPVSPLQLREKNSKCSLNGLHVFRLRSWRALPILMASLLLVHCWTRLCDRGCGGWGWGIGGKGL